MHLRSEKVGAGIKNELAGVINGVELYIPVPENESEKKELEFREKRFYNFLGDIILKYYSEVEEKMNSD